MIHRCLPATGLALLLMVSAAPVLAQQGTPDASGVVRTVPRPLDRPYPGVIRHQVDASDVERKIVRVRQTMPVTGPGPLTLLYPKFIPGNHAPTGPIQLVAGLTVMGNGERIAWQRDTLDPYAFHLDIPAGVDEITVDFQWLTQPDNSVWRVVMTPEMLNLQWEKALLYPAGYAHDQITFQTSIRLPDGWQYGVALDTASFADGIATFAPISLEMLADSPLFAGAHYRRIDIDPGGRTPVHLHIVADNAAAIAPTPEQLAGFEAMVDQADLLFGVRPFDRYEFLLGLTSRMGGIGLEHHRSSENTAPPGFFTEEGWADNYNSRTLLPHEFVHSWNGKFRRPADLLTPNLNEPTQNSLLWVYEGQTEYWGEVLSARAGLVSKEEALVNLADVAAFYDHQPGREWRPLQDTTNHNLLGYRTTNPWSSWMRGTGDYYREALLVWLDVDTLIRAETGGRKSLDDFARGFFGIEDGVWEARPYRFEDVVAALNAVHPYDWAGFLRSRLDAVGPDAQAPLDGLERGGYRLTYVEEPSEVEQRLIGGLANNFQYSLGFNLSGTRITGIRWGGPMFEAGVGPGWTLTTVNGEPGSAEALRNAVTAAKGGTEPIVLGLRNGDRERTVSFDYHDGLRYPRLERIPGTPDRIGDILAPRSR